MAIMSCAVYSNAPKYIASHYWADRSFAAKTVAVAADRHILVTPQVVEVDVGGNSLTAPGSVAIDLNVVANWDRVTPIDYTAGAARAGKDFYVYLCVPTAGDRPILVLSANSTYPAGYTASNSRKVGGFPCVCADYGTIVGHPLSGYVAGDIIPNGVWDLKFRSESGANEGLAYDDRSGHWAYIYDASQVSAGVPGSVFGGTLWVNVNWMDAVDAARAVKMSLPKDCVFTSIATGSNEGTNIAGTAQWSPFTAGGHSDTLGRRMVSRCACEECCGAIWQWLDDGSYRYDALPFAWLDPGGGKGRLYLEGYDAKLVAGGLWASGALCGSRSRNATNYRWAANSILGFRLVARSITG